MKKRYVGAKSGAELIKLNRVHFNEPNKKLQAVSRKENVNSFGHLISE